MVVADDDLLFSSRLSASLARLGYRAVVVRTAAGIAGALRQTPQAAIVNLAARSFDAVAVIRDAKEDGATRAVPVLGFCGHQDTGRATAAKTAGCDAVATNGMVAADLERVLSPLLHTTRER